MVKDDPLQWEAEPIESFLDEHFLYRGIHRIFWMNWKDLNKIEPNLFSTKPEAEGLSTDWSKYATPDDTLNRLRAPTLKVNGIIELNIAHLKFTIKENKLPLTIKHDPIRVQKGRMRINRAHTLLIGIYKQNRAKMKRCLSKIANWVAGYKPKI